MPHIRPYMWAMQTCLHFSKYYIELYYIVYTGWYIFYHKKHSEENLFMWSPMQKTLILPHIRAMNFRSKFVEISDHVSKLKLYHIEN